MRPGKRTLAAICSLALAGAAGPIPASAADSALESRAAQVRALFREAPAGIAEMFSPEFLAQVPEAQVAAIVGKFFHDLGTCRSVRPAERQGDFQGKFDLSFERGFRVPMSLTIDPRPPNKIVGLWFGNPVRETGGLADVVAELEHLPGEVSLKAVRLDDGKVSAAIHPEHSLAIGSAFKLYLLATLVSDIDAGRHSWEEIARLDPKHASLPSGFLQTWPAGAPVTLHSLAALAISRSDNTAADSLLFTLGRERVESALRDLGLARPERNRPFLSTAEMFRLKWSPKGDAIPEYLRADEAGRRKLLDRLDGELPLENLSVSSAPVAIDSIEWFASADDLCALAAWFQKRTGANGEAARAILAINPGLPLEKSAWPYIGYKGGSEPGVLNLTCLLRDARGRSYAVSASWNDTARSLDEAKFEGFVQRLIELLPTS